MSEFDDLIRRIRNAAREQAEYRIRQATQANSIEVAFEVYAPKFSDEQKEKILAAAEAEAMRKIYAHFHDIAIKSA